MDTSLLNVIPYTRRHHRDLMHLLGYDRYLHVHLDWNSADEWLSDPDMPVFLAWQDDKLVGAMAGSPPLNGSVWLRMVVLAPGADVEATLQTLWETLRAQLVANGVQDVAILLLRAWLMPYAEQLGFAPLESIITLRREGNQVPEPLRHDLKIRPGDLRELATVAEVDHAAFNPIWQLSMMALRQAIRASAYFTVAEIDKQLVAYQLSTLYHDGAHLARLATMPAVQGTGVGGALLTNLVQHFLNRRIRSVSVNTQKSNTQSLRLYQRYGFNPTGLNMDVWSQSLNHD